MKKNILIACTIWTALVLASFAWNYTNAAREQFALAMQTGRAFFQQIVLFRSWNAGYGGVYVPVTVETPPNPYLNVPMRDIAVNGKLTLTKINPAYMTRQVSELALKREGVRFHITSLKPLRPDNRPTEMEADALQTFETGTREKGGVIFTPSGKGFFYMAPLVTERSCLACHAIQGYKEGDIRGGISVTIPYIFHVPVAMLAGLHLFMLTAGLIGLVIAGNRLGRAYAVIRHQAVFDALTGIHNRQSFSERILDEFNRSRRESYPLSVIMGDIDHFKQYNDTYGHLAGDECLKRVAAAIRDTLKRPGDFLARYGGEEFIIILPSTTTEGAAHIAERIGENVLGLGIPHEKSQPRGKVTISLGVATKADASIMSHEELLKMADDALYMAKEKGRNRFQVYGQDI